VALLAGVSVSTASRVLRGIAVEPAMDNRVRDAAEKLGYKPNGLAQALRAGRSNTFGLLIPDVSNPWFGELASAIEDACRLRGIGIVLCNSGNRADQEEGCLDLLWKQHVDGLFMVSVRGQIPSSLAHRTRSHWPVVAFDRALAGPGVDVVMADNIGGMRQLVDHLVAQGYRSIAQIASGAGLEAGVDRRIEVDRALQSHGLRSAGTVIGDFTFESGYAAAAHFLTGDHSTVDAIIAANDLMAVGALQYCSNSGIRVPHDVAVAGFDDMALSSWVSPALTTVRQDPTLLAAEAVELLVSRMNQPETAPRTRVIDCALQVRASTLSPSGAPISHTPTLHPE